MADKKNLKAAKVADEVKSIKQLREDLVKRQNDLIEAKRGHRLGELTNPRVLASIHKDIARIHTAIKAAEIAGLSNSEKENK